MSNSAEDFCEKKRIYVKAQCKCTRFKRIYRPWTVWTGV